MRSFRLSLRKFSLFKTTKRINVMASIFPFLTVNKDSLAICSSSSFEKKVSSSFSIKLFNSLKLLLDILLGDINNY